MPPDEPITVGEVGRAVLRLEQKVDDTNRRLEGKFDAVTQDHEARLRRNERWIAALPLTLLLAIGSMVAAILNARGW